MLVVRFYLDAITGNRVFILILFRFFLFLFFRGNWFTPLLSKHTQVFCFILFLIISKTRREGVKSQKSCSVVFFRIITRRLMFTQ